MILALFFTRGVSLKLWVDTGLFDREKILYEEHLNRNNFQKVYWFTYGVHDRDLSIKLKKEGKLHTSIEVFDMPRFFNINKVGSYFYSLCLPFYYLKELKRSDILKTNQMDGSWSAIISSKLNKKKFILRTGYTLSQLEYNKNNFSKKYKIYRFIEKLGYKNCNKAVVSSINNRNYLIDNKYINDLNINIIRNFIDIDKFKCNSYNKYEDRIIFVGRLNVEKNIFNLLDAIKETNLKLDIYGYGDEEQKLKDYAINNNVLVEFKGKVSNTELPRIYNKYKYYILPSFFEGMPKTLLEAMSCGCICIGTNVNGINEVIIDKYNGYLANDTTSNEIAKAINLACSSDNSIIIKNAVETIHEKFSLNGILEQEEKLYKELVSGE